MTLRFAASGISHRQLLVLGSSGRLSQERLQILRIHTMLLKGIIGAGQADTVLAAIRKAFAPAIFGPPFVKAEGPGLRSSGYQ